MWTVHEAHSNGENVTSNLCLGLDFWWAYSLRAVIQKPFNF